MKIPDRVIGALPKTVMRQEFAVRRKGEGATPAEIAEEFAAAGLGKNVTPDAVRHMIADYITRVTLEKHEARIANKTPVANVLPKDVRDALVMASRVNILDRNRAVHQAIDEARRKYPQLFKE